MGRTWPAVVPGALVVALLVQSIVYGDTLYSIVLTWRSNSTFSHGFLIPPICAWLIWRKRHEIAATQLRPSWAGVPAILACVAGWIVGKGTGVIGLEQFAVVAMVPGLVLTILGPPATRVLAFPLGFLVFAVPIGHALISPLMFTTADVATWALQLTGVPIHRSGMYIEIPAGRFEVARACSGLNYVITGLALGSLYSVLSFAGWRKRLVSILGFVVVPVIANGLRVYLTILASHLTDMRFGPGPEHVTFGRVFFLVVVFAMFLVGQRWRDEVPPRCSEVATRGAEATRRHAWLAVAAAMIALLSGPPYLQSSVSQIERRLASNSTLVRMPHGNGGWTGERATSRSWRPRYSGAVAEGAGIYRDDVGRRVDVFSAAYGLGTTGGGEMISYGNRISSDERRSHVEARTRTIALRGSPELSVSEQVVRDSDGRWLVWYWYMVGERRAVNPYEVKAHEAIAFLMRRGVPERIVTLATPLGPEAREALERFVAAHSGCVVSGFAGDACGP